MNLFLYGNKMYARQIAPRCSLSECERTWYCRFETRRAGGDYTAPSRAASPQATSTPLVQRKVRSLHYSSIIIHTDILQDGHHQRSSRRGRVVPSRKLPAPKTIWMRRILQSSGKVRS